jgi:hypothetical protein
MKIQDAIKTLQEAQKNGTKNIILAFWDAEAFCLPDDKTWAVKT